MEIERKLARSLRRLVSGGSAGSGVQLWVGPVGARVPHGDLSQMAASASADDDLGPLSVGTEVLVRGESYEVAVSVDDGLTEVVVYRGPTPAAVLVEPGWPEAGVLVVSSVRGAASFTFTRA